MKIAVFGNCQAAGLAECLKLLSPRLEAEPFAALDAATPAGAREMAQRVADYDLVLTQPFKAGKYGAMSADELASAGKRVVLFPQIPFTGFHPDWIIVPGAGGGPFGHYHSIIMSAAYLAGVPERRAPALFNTYVFARLGYLDEYERAMAFLLSHIAKTQLDGPGLFARWAAMGQFMYTPNHPRIEVLRELAIVLCRKIGVTPNLSSPVPDDALARNLRLPVYPEIAARVGVQGSRETTLLRGQVLSLEEVVQVMYRRYEAQAPDFATDPRVAAAIGLLRDELDCLGATAAA